jgi:tricorn protease
MARLSGFVILCFGFVLCGFAQGSAPLLLRNPSLNRDKIAFLYARDVWTVSREGGEARRLTSAGSVVAGPFYSPNGTQIAYSTSEHGLTDVYVVNADGGVPRRLTWEPTGNYAGGWTADGKDVLFASTHFSYAFFFRLFRVHADGTGSPAVLPLPSAAAGNYSADGNTLAYVPVLLGSSEPSECSADRPLAPV